MVILPMNASKCPLHARPCQPLQHVRVCRDVRGVVELDEAEIVGLPEYAKRQQDQPRRNENLLTRNYRSLERFQRPLY